MKIVPSLNCGLPLKITATVTIVSEIIACGVSIVLSAYSWVNIKQDVQFIYHGSVKDESRNKELAACVSYWILTLIMSFALARVLAALLLALAVKKNSVSLSLFWISLKGTILLLSLFCAISSLTVLRDISIAAWFDFATQLVTCYFICILMPQVEVMAKTFVIPKPEPTSE